MKTLLMLALLACPMAQAAQFVEGQERGAGNLALAKMEKLGREVMNTLAEEERSYPKLPIRAVLDAYNRAKISVVQELPALDGKEVDAVNNPETNEIIFERKAIDTDYRITERTQILIHELLGLARIEDKNYEISRQLMEISLPTIPVTATVNISQEDANNLLNFWAHALNNKESRSTSRVELAEMSFYPLRFRLKPEWQKLDRGGFTYDFLSLRVQTLSDNLSVIEIAPESKICGETIRELMLTCEREMPGSQCYSLKARMTRDGLSLDLQIEDGEDDTNYMRVSYVEAPRGMPSGWIYDSYGEGDDGVHTCARFSGTGSR